MKYLEVGSTADAQNLAAQVPGSYARVLADRCELAYPDEQEQLVQSLDPSNVKPRLFAYAATARWVREVAGITVNGMAVPTDERTRGVLTGARIKADADPNYQISNWKAGAGQYVSLDAAAIIAISDAVEAHIQDCFAANATVDADIAAGTIATEAEVDAAFATALED